MTADDDYIALGTDPASTVSCNRVKGDREEAVRGFLRLVVVAWCAAACAAHAFDLQGHRGARGLAPENTLAAFARALAIGVTTLETDLAVTRDGVP